MDLRCSLLQEIQKVEQSIETCYKRVEELKQKLKSGQIKREQKDSIQKELTEVEKLLATNKRILGTLHKSNSKTFLLASALVLIFFVIWMLYQLAFGDTFN